MEPKTMVKSTVRFVLSWYKTVNECSVVGQTFFLFVFKKLYSSIHFRVIIVESLQMQLWFHLMTVQNM